MNVPFWLGKITEHFKFEIRRYLKPKRGVQSMWLNCNGQALSYDCCTREVKNFVRRLFPNSNITPVSFRRLFVTLVHEEEVHLKEESMENFLNRLARAMNTSPDMFIKHYNRSLGSKNSKLVQEQIEESLLSTPLSEEYKNRLLNSIAHFQTGNIVLKK